MGQYTVKGADESVENVDILGETRKVGEVVELEDSEAVAVLVGEGKLEPHQGEPDAPQDAPQGDQSAGQPVGESEASGEVV